MLSDDTDEVRASFARCEATGEFPARFYERFLRASPEIAPLFADTDFDKQRKLLRATVYIMVTRDVGDAKARETLEKIGRSHGRAGLDIRPELYELWLDCVCATVAEMDPDWSEVLERAWRDRLRPGIELVTSLY